HALDTRYATRTLCKQSREHRKACSHYRCNTWATERPGTKGPCGAKARVYEGADTIDTTGLNAKLGNKWAGGQHFLPVLMNSVAAWTEGLNHDAFVLVPLLFGEITRLLLTGTRPLDKRNPDLAPVNNDEGKTYWHFDEAR